MRSVIVLSTLISTCFAFAADRREVALLDSYHRLAQALAYDKLNDARAAADTLADTAEGWLSTLSSGDFRRASLERVSRGARDLVDVVDADDARLHFGQASEGIVTYLRWQKSQQPSWQLYYCPMAAGYRYWVQPKSEAMANPYMGLRMLKCGMKRKW